MCAAFLQRRRRHGRRLRTTPGHEKIVFLIKVIIIKINLCVLPFKQWQMRSQAKRRGSGLLSLYLESQNKMKTARAEIKKASTNYRIAFNRNPVAQAAMLVLLGAVCVMPAVAQTDASAADASSAKTLEAVTITSQREARVSTGATGLNLDIKETPQSISVVTAEQMQDFGTTSINEALRLSTGLVVDEWETNRTTYTLRGFDIANTQVDGVGMPNGWGIVTGAVDTFGYEKIEVIRGANGLLTGVGNAAGTINFVRKRPTNEKQGEVNLSYGSWNTKRVEADYSTPFNETGTWAARVVAAREEGGAYLRDKENERTFLYGVVDGQVGDNGTLTLGYSHQQDNTDGVMWGALSFGNNDGTQSEWKRNASTTQDWTMWDTTTQNAFVEYTHELADDWQLKATYNHRIIETDTKLFYAYFPSGSTGLDPATGAGLVGWAGRGKDKRTEDMGEVSVSGHFDAFGRRHEALFGAGMAKARFVYDAYNTDDCGASSTYDGSVGCMYTLPSFPYAGNLIAEPVWGDLSTLEADIAEYTEKRNRVFGSMRLTLTDKLKSIVGFNYAQYKRDGNSFGTPLSQSDSEISPYAGLTYDVTSQLLAYVSYSDLYQPQSQVDEDNNYLDPSKGANIEAGVKMDWLDKRLLTMLAVFQAKQSGLAVSTGATNSFGQSIYEASDYVKSEGVEFEAVGKITGSTDLAFGYTSLNLTDRSGDTGIFPWVPRHTANWMLRTRLPSYNALSFGVSGRWQDEISNTESSGVTVRQDAYAVHNAFAAWRILSNATVRFNVNNLTDEKHINTLRYAGYYGAPRNYEVALNYQF